VLHKPCQWNVTASPAAHLCRSYEAFIIYNFLALCLSYVGGPGVVEVSSAPHTHRLPKRGCDSIAPCVASRCALCARAPLTLCGVALARQVKMNGYVLMPSKFYLTCCLPPLAVNGRFVRHCQQGALQFVLMMPLTGLLTLILVWTGNYTEGYWAPNSGCVRACVWGGAPVGARPGADGQKLGQIRSGGRGASSPPPQILGGAGACRRGMDRQIQVATDAAAASQGPPHPCLDASEAIATAALRLDWV
jgi:Organic solute transporter Ostalpha